MNIYYFSWFTQQAIAGLVLEDIEDCLAAGGEVLVLFCEGTNLPCWANRYRSKSICGECKFNRRLFENRLKGDQLHWKSVESILRDDEIHYPDWQYNSLDDILKLEYEGINVGRGALSTYVSWTRNLHPVMDSDFRLFFGDLLNQQVRLKRAITLLLSKLGDSVESISMFNSRQADVKPVYEVSRQLGVHTRVIEAVADNPEYYRREVFENYRP